MIMILLTKNSAKEREYTYEKLRYDQDYAG